MICASMPLLGIGEHPLPIIKSSVDMHRVALGGSSNIKLRIVHDVDPRQERENLWVGQSAWRELLNEGVAIEQRDRRDVIPVHLGGDDLPWLIGPPDIYLSLLAHSYGQPRQIVRGQSALPQAEYAVHDRVRTRA